MNDKQRKIVIGGLLHDIGKVLYRYHDGRNHSISGYDFLSEQKITDCEILDQVKYHHSAMLKGASLDADSPAYITYWADNVAAGLDRRSRDEETELVYDRLLPLQSVFNILNGNRQKYSYELKEVFDDGEINYPSVEAATYSEEDYGRIFSNLRSGIAAIEFKDEYVNSLLSMLEANLSFVPSSTDMSQYADISLFDHVKITAAIGSCIYQYLEENGIDDYREALYKKAKEFYGRNTMLLFSMDISGIQEFIFSVDSKGALKSLRAKSFYLEIMLEHIIDEILYRLDLSRANLIYSGGGHAYMLLPNTEAVKQKLEEIDSLLRNWFIDNFGTALYVAFGYEECSANALCNEPEGSYAEIFRSVSRKISDRKSARYSAEEIVRLNRHDGKASVRECRVCGRTDRLTEEDICEFCEGFKEISAAILREPFIVITSSRDERKASLRLPLDRYMLLEDEEALRSRMKTSGDYIRSYSKNKMYTGMNVSTRLWVGDYAKGSTFENLAETATGVKKIGVLRADVDNLGEAFVKGFDPKTTSLSRTATFSRKLSMFFKLHINNILDNGEFSLSGTGTAPRNALIVYSGGDDVFLVGSWDDVTEAAVDLTHALYKFSQGTLTMSAGIGIFPPKYPVKALARQTGELEDAAKDVPGKAAITLFEASGENSYSWDIFENKVINEKYKLIDEYFSVMPDKGMSALYKIMSYIRGLDDRINLARLAYMLGRIEPDKDASEVYKELYKRFSKNLYEWLSGENRDEERRELLTAIYLYVYLHRERSEK